MVTFKTQSHIAGPNSIKSNVYSKNRARLINIKSIPSIMDSIYLIRKYYYILLYPIVPMIKYQSLLTTSHTIFLTE